MRLETQQVLSSDSAETSERFMCGKIDLVWHPRLKILVSSGFSVNPLLRYVVILPQAIVTTLYMTKQYRCLKIHICYK